MYVYLQIFHPSILRGDFLNKPPLKAKSPPPPPSPISKAPPAPGTRAARHRPPRAAPATAVEAGAAPAPQRPAGAGRQTHRRPAAGATARCGRATGQATRTRARERSKPPAVSAARTSARARAPRERRRAGEVVAAEPTGPLEDTVAVRQPEAPAGHRRRPDAGLGSAPARAATRRREALYEKVEQAEPQNVDALLGLAAIATQRGNAELAARQYSRALELEPRNPTAQAGLISLLGQADPAAVRVAAEAAHRARAVGRSCTSPWATCTRAGRSGHRPSRPTSRPTSCSRTIRTTPTTSRWVSST